MKNERLQIIAENLIDHLIESLGRNKEEELHNILCNEIGMTDEEICELCPNFEDDDRSEMPWDYGKHFE